MKRKILSILLVLCMVATMLPVSAFAADGDLTVHAHGDDCEHEHGQEIERGAVQAAGYEKGQFIEQEQASIDTLELQRFTDEMPYHTARRKIQADLRRKFPGAAKPVQKNNIRRT